MINISGFGLKARVIASVTFPNGFDMADFADDSDPLDSPDFVVSETGFGLNGDMVVWSRANGIEIGTNLIPTSESDINCDVLFDANRVGKNKTSARDVITIVWTYPNGDRVTGINGVPVTGTMLPPVAGTGRLKSRHYVWRFEQVTKTRAPA